MPKRSSPVSATTWLVVAGLACAALLARCGARQTADPSPPEATTSRDPPAASAPTEEPTAEEAGQALDSGSLEPPEPAPVVVAAFGDSLTDGRVGGGGYLAHLRARCPESTFDDFGKGGDMVNMIRRRFFSQVFAADGRSLTGKRYTHVLVFGGVNDLYSDLTAGRTVQKVSTDLDAMYLAARRHPAKVVAITVAPWGGFTKYYNERRGEATGRLNDWIKEQLGAGRVDHVVDAYQLLSCGQPERLCPEYAHPIRDGLHFGKQGHEVLGKALYEAAFSGCR